MKIIVSSKSLAECLNKIDFEAESIERIVADKGEITFITATKAEILSCEIMIFNPMIKQSIDQRWDWVKKLVNQVNEQPIVVHFNEDILNVIFQY
jgi:hypothetical protein